MIPNSGYAETNLRTLSFVKHFFAVIYKTLNLCKILDTFLQVRIVTNADLLKALLCQTKIGRCILRSKRLCFGQSKNTSFLMQ